MKLILTPRYAFDDTGQLIPGKVFRFVEKAFDREAYLASLDTLILVLCLIATTPEYLRGISMCFSFLSLVARRGIKGMENSTCAANDCVSTRIDDDGQVINEVGDAEAVERRGLLQKSHKIFSEQGQEVNFMLGELQLEVQNLLYTLESRIISIKDRGLTQIDKLASSATTSVAIRAIFYFLLKISRVYRKPQEEIDKATNDGFLSVLPK